MLTGCAEAEAPFPCATPSATTAFGRAFSGVDGEVEVVLPFPAVDRIDFAERAFGEDIPVGL